MSETIGTTIGANITASRKAVGYVKQGDFADKLGVSQSQLSDWENDRYGAPDLKTILKIAAAIPCDISELLRGIDADYDRVYFRERRLVEIAPGVLMAVFSKSHEERLRDLSRQTSGGQSPFSEAEKILPSDTGQAQDPPYLSRGQSAGGQHAASRTEDQQNALAARIDELAALATDLDRLRERLRDDVAHVESIVDDFHEQSAALVAASDHDKRATARALQAGKPAATRKPEHKARRKTGSR